MQAWHAMIYDMKKTKSKYYKKKEKKEKPIIISKIAKCAFCS